MAAEKTIGTTLTKVTSPELLVADLTKIGEIGVTSDEIDVTTLDSTGGYKEFIGGFKDAGEVAIEGFIKSEANVEAMLALAEAQTVVDWKIESPSGSKWEFSGFVKSFKESEVTVAGVRGFAGSIRVSGAPEYTKATVVSA